MRKNLTVIKYYVLLLKLINFKCLEHSIKLTLKTIEVLILIYHMILARILIINLLIKQGAIAVLFIYFIVNVC